MRLGVRNVTLPLSLLFLLIFTGDVLALSLRLTGWMELRRAAATIVSGQVASLTSEYTRAEPLHGVQTRMALTDVQTLAGTSARRQLDVLLPGGTLGDKRVEAPGTPKFQVGERLVLFLTTETNGDLVLVGHGLGVYRISPDGKSVAPDVCAEGGPGRRGETYEQLLERLALPLTAATPPAGKAIALCGAGASPARPTEDGWATTSAWGGWLAALFALALIGALLLRRKRAKAALLLAVAAFASAFCFAPRKSAADGANSREFAFTGSLWDLYTPQVGRVQEGRVLWVQGQGTPDIPDDVAFGVIQQQFQKWEDIPDSAFAFRKDGVTSEAGQATDQRNVISFVAKAPRKVFNEFTLAITFLVSRGINPSYFVDTDMAFNNQDFSWVTTGGNNSLEVVALHEAGHVLGLDHTQDPNDVMFPTAHGVTVLSAGDVQGAAALYPILPAAQPVAVATGSPRLGAAPLTVSFSSLNSLSRIGAPLTYAWDFGDGTPAANEPSPAHTYAAPGVYTGTLTVTDPNGTATDTVTITVGAAGNALTARKFGLVLTLIAPQRGPGKDKLSFVLSGTSVQPGDKIRVTYNDILISGLGARDIPLDGRGSFKGSGNLADKLSVKLNVKSRELSVMLTNAGLDLSFDPRGNNEALLAGTAPARVVIYITRATGETVVEAADFTFSYTVKQGNTPNGFLQKVVTGKL